MSETLEQVGGTPGKLANRSLIEQTLEKWRRQKKHNHLEEEVMQAAGLNSLCWTCQRAGWDCLCRWPEEEIPGIETQSLEPLDYEWPLLKVVTCPLYWPERINEYRIVIQEMEVLHDTE